MIRFECPRCKTGYSVPSRAAGKKCTCRTCGQRLQVPAEEIVPGRLLPSQPPLQSSATGVTEGVATPVTFNSPPPHTINPGLVALALVASLVAVATTVILVALSLPHPSESVSSQKTSDNDLAAHPNGDKTITPAKIPIRIEEPEIIRNEPPTEITCTRLRTEEPTRWQSKRLLVVGRVRKITSAGFSYRLFHNIDSRDGVVLLGDTDSDQADTICVFQGGCPIGLEVGRQAHPD
jgi:hypothetical protein